MLRVPVGATLVRHSDPAGEVAETHAKAAGVLAALGVRAAAPRPAFEGARLADDPRVRAALAARRADLAPFWLRMQEQPSTLTGHALVVDGEDTFTAMLAHVLRVAGLEVTVRRYDDPGLRAAALAWEGPVVLGPGPGNPAESSDAKMRMLRGLAAGLLAGHRGGLLGVCLGHELLAAELGLPLIRKAEPAAGGADADRPVRDAGGGRASTTRTPRTAPTSGRPSWPRAASRSPATRRRARCTPSAQRRAASRGSSSTRSRSSPSAAPTCCATS